MQATAAVVQSTIKYEMLQWSVEAIMLELELSKVAEDWFHAEMRKMRRGKKGKKDCDESDDEECSDYDDDDWEEWEAEEDSLQASATNLMSRFINVVAL